MSRGAEDGRSGHLSSGGIGARRSTIGPSEAGHQCDPQIFHIIWVESDTYLVCLWHNTSVFSTEISE